jgi:REP element-mobilizing transposase RayT
VPAGGAPGPRIADAGALRAAALRQCWLVDIHTLFRRPVFDDTDAARAVSRLHRARGAWCGSECLAWVLLPDRWQGLLAIAPGDALERLVQRFKTASARVVDPRLRINGWLWERGFDARLLADGDERDAARRLVIEPLRAGLAGAIGDYPYWDAVWLDGGERERSARR